MCKDVLLRRQSFPGSNPEAPEGSPEGKPDMKEATKAG